MKHIFTVFLLIFFSFGASAQEDSSAVNRGTIRIQKKGELKKVIFDDVNYRLVGMDRAGNVLDSAIVSFEMSVIIKGMGYSEVASGPFLSSQMRQVLATCDRTSQIYFKNIEARDRYGTTVKMPSFRHTYGYSDEDND